MTKKIPPEFLWGVAILLLLAGLAYPVILRVREESRNASCKNNLKNIGLLMKMYSQADGTPFTLNSFEVLFDADIADNANVFICPSSGKQPGNASDLDKWTDYIVLPLTNESASAMGIVGYCKYHKQEYAKTNILYGDGHIESGTICEEKKSP